MTVRILLDGQALDVPAGATLAAALAGAATRRSVAGEWRSALCGMGVCFECRVRVNDQRHQRACQIVVYEGMEVQRED